jgi:NTP pyrophosphatase (non-canonical NTP hydrolase)
LAVEFSDYQRAASETSQLRLGGPQGAIAPMLGLASETGSILNVYKKYLRDGIGLAANRALLREELGDLLWYAAAVATACGLDLEDIAQANLARTRDRDPRCHTEAERGSLPAFDAAYPDRERFPRRLVVAVTGQALAPGRQAAVLTLVSAKPNAFPDGPVSVGGKPHGFRVGAALGDPLTDNSRRIDAYRFHDAIHLGSGPAYHDHDAGSTRLVSPRGGVHVRRVLPPPRDHALCLASVRASASNVSGGWLRSRAWQMISVPTLRTTWRTGSSLPLA